MIIIPTEPRPASLLKKVFMHARSWVAGRVREESAANWVKVPFATVEGYRTMAHAILQTDGVDDGVKRFVHDFTEELSAATTRYLGSVYGEGVFTITPAISDRAFSTFYQYLNNWQARRQAEDLGGWEEDQQRWENDGGPMGNPDGP